MKYDRFYFFCPDIAHFPAGGINVIYRFVDILNLNNIQAFVIHKQRKFRNDFALVGTSAVQFRYLEDTIHHQPTDVIFIPEGEVEVMLKLKDMNCKKVVFNQNQAYTLGAFQQLKSEKKYSTYQDFNINDVLVVSDTIKNYLSLLMGNLNIYKVQPYVNLDIFKSIQLKDKKFQIALMPRKNYQNFLEVKEIFNRGKGITLDNRVEINNLIEPQVASVMKESMIFLSLGYPEGFGLPPLEAMASGSIVIGYHGVAGKEYMKDGVNSFVFENGDIYDFSTKLYEVYKDLESGNFDKYQSMADEAVKTAEKYSRQNTEEQLLKFVNELV